MNEKTINYCWSKITLSMIYLDSNTLNISNKNIKIYSKSVLDRLIKKPCKDRRFFHDWHFSTEKSQLYIYLSKTSNQLYDSEVLWNIRWLNKVRDLSKYSCISRIIFFIWIEKSEWTKNSCVSIDKINVH